MESLFSGKYLWLAGFIGANLVSRLFTEVQEGTIVGLDNLNSCYDVSLKEYRLEELENLYTQTVNDKPSTVNYHFVKGSIADRELVNKLFAEHRFDIVVNLAAQAGVRYSIDNSDTYIESNIIGFYNILEACRHSKDFVANEESPHRGLDPRSQMVSEELVNPLPAGESTTLRVKPAPPNHSNY